MAATPVRPRGARTSRLAFGSVSLAGCAAIVLAMGPVWAPPPVSAEVLATPLRAVENAEILAAAETQTVTPPTTAPPVPTSVPAEPDLIIVEVHRRVPAGTPGAARTAPIVSDPGSPATGSAASVAGAAPAATPTQPSTPTRAAATGPAAAPATPAPAAAPRAAPTPAPAPPPPPAPAPTAPPRTSSSG